MHNVGDIVLDKDKMAEMGQRFAGKKQQLYSVMPMAEWGQKEGDSDGAPSRCGRAH